MIAFLLIVFVLLSLGRAEAITVDTKPTLSGVSSNAAGQAVSVKGYTTIAFQVAGSFVATVTFKASVDGTNFAPIGCVPIDTNSDSVTSTTSTGIWRCNVVSINSLVRADVTNYESGTVTVTVGLTAAGVS